jgi:hypothetical protein
MAQPLSASNAAIAVQRPRSGVRSAVLWGGAGFGGLLLAAAVALWFHYGTTVFFETIAAGFANCF